MRLIKTNEAIGTVLAHDIAELRLRAGLRGEISRKVTLSPPITSPSCLTSAPMNCMRTRQRGLWPRRWLAMGYLKDVVQLQ